MAREPEKDGGLLVPAEPRSFPGQRGVKISARALHVLCAGTWVGAFLVDAPADVRLPWLWAAVASGALLLSIDLFESGAFLLQVRGLVVVAKVAALACLPLLGAAAAPALAALVVLSVVSSHAPSSWRYRLVFGTGRVEGARTKG